MELSTPSDSTNGQRTQVEQLNSTNTSFTRAQAFVQANGQILEISNDYLLTKLVWEYFMRK